ncbi:MAG TPA: hypothetical protein PKV16_08545 [Caldisericia bacterium]|nr:hypothetical protein [Caldisericia bacterium]HPF49349.1 hypothetical protein [Caldisericia bacterium]HPI84425.1 hypothetical protein [Caldisericia bacterium]HPQ93814.1 hypothetical protein [Caldisericia bacterium]HRV75622.1 hypothetical protein [Caldisericia bacterium]
MSKMISKIDGSFTPGEVLCYIPKPGRGVYPVVLGEDKIIICDGLAREREIGSFSIPTHPTSWGYVGPENAEKHPMQQPVADAYGRGLLFMTFYFNGEFYLANYKLPSTRDVDSKTGTGFQEIYYRKVDAEDIVGLTPVDHMGPKVTLCSDDNRSVFHYGNMGQKIGEQTFKREVIFPLNPVAAKNQLVYDGERVMVLDAYEKGYKLDKWFSLDSNTPKHTWLVERTPKNHLITAYNGELYQILNIKTGNKVAKEYMKGINVGLRNTFYDLDEGGIVWVRRHLQNDIFNMSLYKFDNRDWGTIACLPTVKHGFLYVFELEEDDAKLALVLRADPRNNIIKATEFTGFDSPIYYAEYDEDSDRAYLFSDTGAFVTEVVSSWE